jgi:hypothetical protein
MVEWFARGGIMMFVILMLDFVLIMLAALVFIAAFGKVRSQIVYYVSMVAAVFPTILGITAYRQGLAALEASTAGPTVIDPAVVAAGQAEAAMALKFGIISTVVFLAISIAALMVRKSRNRKEDELVEFV